MAAHFSIINGPNLNLLGSRQKDIYGEISFEHYFAELQDQFNQSILHYEQHNEEGALVQALHKAQQQSSGVVLNAGAYTHSSIALADAVAGIAIPVIEVHISNVWRRESFRHHSYLSPVCAGIMAGMGLDGYRLALLHLLHLQQQ